MTLIEGVGDEVVQFLAIVVIILIAAVAWWSTNARPDRFRTVFMIRHSRTNRPSVTVSIRSRTRVANQSQSGVTRRLNAAASVTESNVTEHARVIPVQAMDSIVDADMAMLDDDRLRFYRRLDNTTVSPENVPAIANGEAQAEDGPSEGNAQIREMDSIVSAMEADVTTGCEFFERPGPQKKKKKPLPKNKKSEKQTQVKNNQQSNIEGDTGGAIPVESDGTNKIQIRLKYLNDTIKEVDGTLTERLRDFKRRHFSTELTSDQRVRLIFNGRVLVNDTATLEACGLHDRAVVHCLVHPRQRNQRPQQISVAEMSAINVTPREVFTEAAPQERSWDLENVLMTLLSVGLTVVWFFRCEYSNMFTASASVALFGLTVFYSVAIFGLYLSDTFQFNQRNPQPVPQT